MDPLLSIVLIPDNFDARVWDEIATHPLQSYAWGQARIRMGKQVFRFGEYSASVLKAVYQMTVHPVPYTGYSIGYIPRSVLPSETFLLFLKDFCHTHKIISVQFEPNVFIDDEFGALSPLLTRSRTPLLPAWTQDILLSGDEQSLLAHCDKDTRYAIRLALREGVVVRDISDIPEGYSLFEKMYFETTKRQGFLGHSTEHQRIVWETMSAQNQAKLFGSFYNDTLLAVFEVFYFKKQAYYLYGGSATTHRRLSGPTIGLWHIICQAQREGYESFDFWGSLPPEYSALHPWAGFTKFKEGFGTRFRQYVGSHDLVVFPLLYRFFGTLFFVRSKALKFFAWSKKHLTKTQN